MTKTALLVVDVQKDFCEGGALPVTGGNMAAEAIGQHLAAHADAYDLIVFSQDWHNPLEGDPTGNCGHFAIPPAEPDYLDTWPVHCVRYSEGASFHPAVDKHVVSQVALRTPYALVHKGQGVPAYSLFEGSVVHTPFQRFDGATVTPVLKGLGITRVEVCGLALDHCVRASAQDAVNAGFAVTVLSGMTAAVGSARDTLKNLNSQGVAIS